MLPLVLLIATALMPAASATNVNKCADLVKLTVQELIGVKRDFPHNTRYTHELDVTTIKDQCQYGGCWIYGTLSHIEQKILAKTGKAIDLSEQYLIVESLRVRALDALKIPGQTVAMGGTHSSAEWLIERFGAVPDQAWKPRIPFEESPNSKRMMYFLNSRIAKFHIDAAKEGLQAAEKLRLAQEAEKDVLDLIETYSGPLPKSFEYEGKQFSPETWAKAHLPKDDREIVWMYPKRGNLPEPLEDIADGLQPKVRLKKLNTIKPKNFSEGTTLEEMEKELIAAIRRGETVPLSFEVQHHFIDRETGIMSLDAFHLPKDYVNPPEAYRDAFDMAGGGHLVDVVGVDVDEKTGRIIKLKIKNSWGKKAGDAGYYHMYRDYFEQFVSGIYARKTPK